MLGIAESQEGYSRILARNLVIGFEYKLDQLAELLEIQVESMKRKVVVCRGDAQLLFIHLKKDKYSTPQYEDHLEGGILFWSGQNRIKVVEKNLLDLKKDVFVFIQPERKTPFEYYGRALPLRIQINWEPDIPSRIAFDLVEYNAQKSKTTGMFLNNHSNLILHDSEAPHSTVKDAFVTVRAAQTLYRQRALQLWGNMCAVTSVDNPGWLIASHIKPWRESSDVERVDPANSLMLTPNYDKLFDRGVISFSPDNC